MIWFILYIVIAFGLMVAEGYCNTFDGEWLLAFLACIVWPLALAVEVAVLIFSAVHAREVAGEGAEAMTRLQRFLSMSWLSIGDNKFPVMGPNDIVPGHEKPTMILARMLAAEILQHLDVEQSPPVTTGSRTRKSSLTFPSLEWEIHERYESSDGCYFEVWCFEYRVFVVNGAVVKFSDEEVKILSGARTQRDALVARKKTADAETARQQAAIDAIAKICKIPETLAVSDGRGD